MPSTRSQRLRLLAQDLKRRRVFRTTAVYLVGAFAVLQGVDVLVPALHLPEWTMTLMVILALAGLPVAVGLAWAFDIVPGPAVRRTPGDAAGVNGSTLHPARPGGSPSPVRALPVLAAGPSVAVVPFLDLSGDPDNEVFADGITEDVIAHLSKIRALKVISRTSVMPFKERGRSLREIGAALGATTLLDGSVRRDGERVRIVAQLVDAETDRHLWAETYDRELTDIFAIQTDVALHIATALEAELSPEERSRIGREPTSSIEAYQHYLKGRHWFIQFTPTGLKRSIQHFERALAGDPAFVLAHVGIAMAYAELSETGVLDPDEARPAATEAASAALRLDPGLGESHCARAYLKCIWEFDWAGAEAGFRRAIELCPNSADAYDLYGRMCAAIERYDEALALQRRARELDPLAHRLDVASTLLRAGRYAEAGADAARAVEFDPDHDRAHATLGWALLLQGQVDEGIAEIERAVDLAPDNPQWFAQLGQALARTGRTDEARDILRRLEARAEDGYITPYHRAYVHTGLGEHERALDFLELAFDQRAGSIYGIKGSFLLAPLRHNPRFEALLARMNLA